MRVFAVALISLLVAGSAAAQTQAELTEQAKGDFLNADRDLGRLVDHISRRMDPDQAAKLQAAQNVWTQYRDAAAASESSFYSGGSVQTMVHFNVMKDLTNERINRLKNMMADFEKALPQKTVPPPPLPVPVQEDPRAVIDRVLRSPDVGNDVAEMHAQLGDNPAAATYLDVVVPSGNDLVAVLTRENLNPDFLGWIRDHPEAGRDIVKVAVGRSMRERMRKEKKDWKNGNLYAVTQFLQGAGNGSALGQIAGDLAVKPMAPYKFFQYLMGEDGMKDLTERYIGFKLNPR